MSRRHLRRKEKLHRHTPVPPRAPADPPPIIREATRVERLAYTRSQAAEALGISRSTFIRRVLPFVETIETGWGMRLVPVDEVERFVAERRRKAHAGGGGLRGPAAESVSRSRSSLESARNTPKE